MGITDNLIQQYHNTWCTEMMSSHSNTQYSGTKSQIPVSCFSFTSNSIFFAFIHLKSTTTSTHEKVNVRCLRMIECEFLVLIWFSSIQFNFFNTITYGRKDLFLILNREHASFPPSRSQLYLNSAKRLLKAGVCSCVWLVANLLKVQSEGWTLSDRSLELR